MFLLHTRYLCVFVPFSEAPVFLDVAWFAFLSWENGGFFSPRCDRRQWTNCCHRPSCTDRPLFSWGENEFISFIIVNFTRSEIAAAVQQEVIVLSQSKAAEKPLRMDVFPSGDRFQDQMLTSTIELLSCQLLRCTDLWPQNSYAWARAHIWCTSLLSDFDFPFPASNQSVTFS